jgi:hypothetical protein
MTGPILLANRSSFFRGASSGSATANDVIPIVSATAPTIAPCHMMPRLVLISRAPNSASVPLSQSKKRKRMKKIASGVPFQHF